MKKPDFLIMIALTSIAVGLFSSTSAQTSADVLNKSIAFYDPQGKWSDFSGNVHLMTVFADGNSSGGEIIEIQTKEGYYQCTKLPSKAVIGIRNGECFRDLEGNKNPEPDLIKKYGMEDETIQQYKGWHYFHFGTLMELKASGLVLQDKLEKVKFLGNDCFTLKFTYSEARIKNDFYKGSNWTFFIDPANYSIKGFKVEREGFNYYAVLAGIITVNEIKLPLCRTYFKNEDDSFYMVDIFTQQ